MEFSWFSAWPFCFLLLAVFTTQQFRCWPAHVPITEREGGIFRHYCFGCARRYLLCASLYFFANAAFYVLLLAIAALAGISANASTPWLLLVVAIVLPSLPGLSRPRNALRYQLQRHVFSPALPSPSEAQLWRELCYSDSDIPAAQAPQEMLQTVAERSARRWEKLLLVSAQLQQILEANPRHPRHAELAELVGFIREKTVSLQQRGVRDTALLELLLGCCYLAVARLVVHETRSETERRARLWELGLPIN